MAKVFPDGWRELSATGACCAAKRRWWNSPADKLGKLLEEFGPAGSERTRHNPHLHLLGIFAPMASDSLPGQPKSPPALPAPRDRVGSRAHQVVPGARAGRGAKRPRALARCTTRSSTSARSPCCRETTRSCSAATSTLTGGDDTKAKLLADHGAGLIEPQGKECLPHAEFLPWHRSEVFKEPAREQRGRIAAA